MSDTDSQETSPQKPQPNTARPSKKKNPVDLGDALRANLRRRKNTPNTDADKKAQSAKSDKASTSE